MKITKPKMIIFDYGDTLLCDLTFWAVEFLHLVEGEAN